MKIYTLGETVYDIIFRNGYPVGGCPGGSCLNSSVTLGRLGLPVSFIGDICPDKPGLIIQDFLEKNNVNAGYLHSNPQSRTPLALAFLSESGTAEFEFYKLNNRNFPDFSVPRFTKEDILLFGSYYSINPFLRHNVTKIIKTAKEEGTKIIYDPNFRQAHLHEHTQLFPNILQNFLMADLVRGSVEDFFLISGTDEYRQIYENIAPYCKSIIITSEKNGAWLKTPLYEETYPSENIKPVSTIGAGDNFNAGLIYGLIKNAVNKIDKGVPLPVWDEIIGYGIDFATEVCLSNENYVSHKFAAKYRLQ